jgi:hypothetical protein
VTSACTAASCSPVATTIDRGVATLELPHTASSFLPLPTALAVSTSADKDEFSFVPPASADAALFHRFYVEIPDNTMTAANERKTEWKGKIFDDSASFPQAITLSDGAHVFHLESVLAPDQDYSSFSLATVNASITKLSNAQVSFTH